jgi:hypothetical protein
MPWQLKAEGHAMSEAAEKKLFRLLGKVFGDEEHGVAMPVQFTGDHVQGNPLSPEDQAMAAKSTVSEEEPEAGLVQKGEEYPTQDASTDPEPEVSTEAVPEAQ